MESMSWLAKTLTDEKKSKAVAQLEGIASELGCTVAQLAIAWVAKNPHVSTVITGASKLSQLQSNLGAVDVIAKLTPDVMAKIDAISAPLAQ
jgi:aryl-alcohol dehydrogenase-like predicted oxidoreductase